MVIAITYIVPMAGWMLFRGVEWRPTLEMSAAMLVPAILLIGLAGIAVLASFLAFLATFGLWVPTSLWRPLVLVGTATSATVLLLHPSVWIALPLALNAGLAWVAWTVAWTPTTA